MRIITLAVIAIFLTGCAQSGYKKFYSPYFDAKTLPDMDVELLSEGQEPQVFGTNDFDRDIVTLRQKRYVLVGYSSFNGGYEDTKNAAAQAKLIGATIVLVNSQYTNTQTTTSTLFLPDNKTTYHSGTARANTTYNSSSGGYSGNSNTNATYSGTSTTYGTKAVPITSSQRRYDQNAVYLVKSTRKLKFGVAFDDLNPSQRAELERNTGVVISVVMEDTPAFYANVLAGDVLIAVDGHPVINIKQAEQLMRSVGPERTASEFTIIRKGRENAVNIQFR